MENKYHIELLNVSNKEELQQYNDFVNTHKNGNFYQSFSWSKVKDNWRSEIVILKEESGEICGSALILIKKLPFIPKTMMYIPRGPICDYHDEEVINNLFQGINEVAKKNNTCLLRIDPYIENTDNKAITILKSKGFLITENPDDYSTTQICNHYMLNLNGKTKEEILETFHPKWRYNIRLASKKGVKCIIDNNKIDDFYSLLIETGIRDNFNIRSKKYFVKLLSSFKDKIRLYTCYLDDIPISSAIAINFGKKVFYLYGASSNNYRKYMSNYLIQWEMINWAIESGCTYYDFMGIPYYYDENHPNYGVYRFKKGFNGTVVSYIGDTDYIYAPIIGTFLRKYLSSLYFKRNN